MARRQATRQLAVSSSTADCRGRVSNTLEFDSDPFFMYSRPVDRRPTSSPPLYVLTVGPIGLLVAVPFKAEGAALSRSGTAAWPWRSGLAGIRYHVIGRENIPPDRAVVFCANHQSNVDPPVLFRALHPRLHILYKAEMRKLPVLGRVLEVGGFVAVRRENRDAAFASIEAGRGFDSCRAIRS